LGPDFVKLAAAYGIPGMTVEQKARVGEAFRAAKETEGPYLIDFRIEREENVFPIVPAGESIDRMIRRPRLDQARAAH